MALNRKRLVYFERWFHPIAAKILSEQDDIELLRLEYATPEIDNWQDMSRAVGYQPNARTELCEPWFGNANLIERCPNLLAMCSIGAGYDVIDVTACNMAGIVVASQSGVNFEPVAEHAMALILGLSKKVRMTHLAMQQGKAEDRHEFTGNNIQHKTLGIVGIGHIGSRLAKFANAFDMEVLACDPFLTSEQVERRGARKVELADLLSKSDFVSVHTPRTNETIGMFDSNAFAQMKPTAFFINTARGMIHKEDALVDALRAGTLGGAGVDVFDKEPPAPDNPLLHMPNVLATPHIAGATHEANYAMSTAAAEQWIGILRGRVPSRIVNPEVWPLYSRRFEQIMGFAPDPLP